VPQRIVVSFRGELKENVADSAYLHRALAMKERAEALGATLCAWSAQTFAFDFGPDEFEEAISLAAQACEGELAEERFSAGLSQGEMRTVGEGSSLAMLSWGIPLVTAVALARDARAGQVLLDPALFPLRTSDLTSLGWCIVGERGRSVLVRCIDESTVDHEVGTAPHDLAELAKQALLQGDIMALDQFIIQLRGMGHHEDWVERMSGLAALKSGATADALRRLGAAVDSVREPAQRARARLAYGVALAHAGEGEGAILETLEALARAREASDVQGEHACALFLARLSAAAGHHDAASTWNEIAARRAGPASG
jgi:hypothetical protein